MGILLSNLPRQPCPYGGSPCRAGLIVQGICFKVTSSGTIHRLVSGQLDFFNAGQAQIIHFLLEGCPVVGSQFARTINELRNTGHLCIEHRSEQVCNFLALVVGELQSVRGTQVFIGIQTAGSLSDQRRIPLEEGFVVNGLADSETVTQEAPALLTCGGSLFGLIVNDELLVAVGILKAFALNTVVGEDLAFLRVEIIDKGQNRLDFVFAAVGVNGGDSSLYFMLTVIFWGLPLSSLMKFRTPIW